MTIDLIQEKQVQANRPPSEQPKQLSDIQQRVGNISAFTTATTELAGETMLKPIAQFNLESQPTVSISEP